MAKQLRICIVTPRHLSANPRVVKEAWALSEAGHHISIICGHYVPSAIEIDSTVAMPDWSIRPVKFGGRVASKHIHLWQRMRQAFARNLITAGVATPSVLTAAHSPVAPDLRSACDRPADIFIAHYVAALPAAAEAAKRFNVPYAFDAEDFHPGDLPNTTQYSLENEIIRGIESLYLPDAAYITAGSPLIAKAYSSTYGITLPTPILNVFPRASAPGSPSPRGSAQPGPSLYWFSQTIGAGRGLETAIEAIARATSKPHFYLRGMPSPGYDATLRNLAVKCGVSDRLHFLPLAPPNDLERLGAIFDIGLVSELNETPNRQIALTNKIFSYLTSGIPSIASDIPAHREISQEFGEATRLFPIGDVGALAAAIDSLLLNPALLAAARAQAWKLGQGRFSWEFEKTAVISALTTVNSLK